MVKMNWIDWTAFTLLVIGGLNWGLVGVFDFNLVSWLFGTGVITTIVYVLVGISGLISAFSLYKLAK